MTAFLFSKYFLVVRWINFQNDAYDGIRLTFLPNYLTHGCVWPRFNHIIMLHKELIDLENTNVNCGNVTASGINLIILILLMYIVYVFACVIFSRITFLQGSTWNDYNYKSAKGLQLSSWNTLRNNTNLTSFVIQCITNAKQPQCY